MTKFDIEARDSAHSVQMTTNKQCLGQKKTCANILLDTFKTKELVRVYI